MSREFLHLYYLPKGATDAYERERDYPPEWSCGDYGWYTTHREVVYGRALYCLLHLKNGKLHHTKLAARSEYRRDGSIILQEFHVNGSPLRSCRRPWKVFYRKDGTVERKIYNPIQYEIEYDSAGNVISDDRELSSDDESSEE